MAKNSTHQVVVGNIGIVCDTSDENEAASVFDEYVRLSKAKYGRVANEPVILMEVFEGGTVHIVNEYTPQKENE